MYDDEIQQVMRFVRTNVQFAMRPQTEGQMRTLTEIFED